MTPLICAILYLVIGVAFTVVITRFVGREPVPPHRDLLDRMTLIYLGIVAAITWPLSLPLALTAFAWKRIDDYRERKNA